MNTPAIALTWEIWRKNQRHIMGIAGILLFFIIVYPGLCRWMGFNPESADAADEFAHLLAANLGKFSLLWMSRVLFILFLVGGPAVAMILTLGYVTWMFTFTEHNRKTKDPMAFCEHIFNLPISTSALFWQLVLGGLVTVLGLHAIWVYCVHMPHLPSLEVFNALIGMRLWITILVLTQAIVWSLAAWPFLRMLTLITVSWSVTAWLAGTAVNASLLVLVPVFVGGMALGHASLTKMRHGQWQGWAWRGPQWFAPAELRGPSRFTSPTQAQVWFEWRRAGRGLVVPAILLEFVPVILLWLRHLAGYDRLSAASMDGLAMYLAYLPPFLFLIFGISLSFELAQGKRDQPFVLVRPLANGGLVIALLLVTALSAVLTWVAALGAFAILPFLGDFSTVTQSVSPLVGGRIACVVGLIFLTWRLAVVNLCFGLTGRRWLAHESILLPMVFGISVGGVSNSPGFNRLLENWVLPHILALAAGLLTIKFLLAGVAFRACLRRNLLARAELIRCLTVWLLLVATLLATFLLLVPRDKGLTFPICLGIILLVPLARLGFAALTLAWHRHVK